MKIPEMAWKTEINFTLSYSSVYCIRFIIQNVYIFCLLSYRNSNDFVHFGDFLELHEFLLLLDMWIFLCEGALWRPVCMKKTVCLVLMSNPIINWSFF